MYCTNLRLLLPLPFLFAVAYAAFPESTVAENGQAPAELAKLIMKDRKVIIGETISETPDNFVLRDLESGQKVTVPKEKISTTKRSISEKEASYTIGLPKVLAWRIVKLVPKKNPVGRIAKLDDQIIYVSLGSQSGISRGHQLRVYRDESEVKDPATGTTLGVERRMVAKLVVTDVFDNYAKAKIQGDLEPRLVVGDTVEPEANLNTLAVLPFVSPDGEETHAGRDFQNKLIAGLSEWDMPVVERSRLASVLTELALQNTPLFDPDSAQRLGKHSGACAVLFGTMTPNQRSTQVDVRLVAVETGKILFAGEYQMLPNRNGNTAGVSPRLGGNTQATPVVVSEGALPRRKSATGGVIGHWPLDGDVRDTAGEDHGELFGGAAYSKGRLGKSVSLDGKGSYVYIPNTKRLSVRRGDFTIAAWVNLKENPQGAPVIAKGGYNWKQGWVLDIGANRQPGAIRLETSSGGQGGNGSIVSGRGVIQPGRWHHIAVCIHRASSGRMTKIFVDGNVVAEGDIRDGDLDGDTNLCFGKCDQYHCQGLIDDVWLFSRALPAGEVRALMQLNSQ